jgi:hypothetical protein
VIIKKEPRSKPPVSVPTFTDVARLVAGADAPPWLSEHFKRWAPSLALDRCVQAVQPTKAAMKKQLTAVEDAALLLARALSDASTREFLEIAGRTENTVALVNPLHDVAERAKRAAASPALSTQAGKTKAGRSRAMPPNAISAKTYCAVLIAETWAYLHGRHPAPRNLQAAAAANAYWRASRGKATGWGKDPLTGWSPYFKKAKAPAAAPIRGECRRHLIEAARNG